MPKPHKKQHDAKTEEELASASTADNRPLKCVGALVGFFAVLVGSMQAFLFLTTFRDPRIALVHRGFEQLNITSTFNGHHSATVSATESVTLVPATYPEGVPVYVGPEEHRPRPPTPNAVLGVSRTFKPGDVVLALPIGSFAEPSLNFGKDKETFLSTLLALPALEERESDARWRSMPRPMLGLATWALLELRRGPASPFAPWFDAIKMSNESASAMTWPAEVAGDIAENYEDEGGGAAASAAGSGCIAKFFARDAVEAKSMPEFLEQSIKDLVCRDADLEAAFPTEHNLLCGAEALSKADFVFATDIVLRRSLQNQALVPFFDFVQVSAASTTNVAPRFSHDRTHLEFVAISALEKGAPLRFQRYMGRLDALVRTSQDMGGVLEVEAAVGGRLPVGHPGEKLVQKLCNEQAGRAHIKADGTPSPELVQCLAVYAGKDSKKQLAALKKSPETALMRDAKLRKAVAAMLSGILADKVEQIKQADNAETGPCQPFAAFKQSLLETYEKAVSKLADVQK